jgi:hypothetical protein
MRSSNLKARGGGGGGGAGWRCSHCRCRCPPLKSAATTGGPAASPYFHLILNHHATCDFGKSRFWEIRPLARHLRRFLMATLLGMGNPAGWLSIFKLGWRSHVVLTKRVVLIPNLPPRRFQIRLVTRGHYCTWLLI